MSYSTLCLFLLATVRILAGLLAALDSSTTGHDGGGALQKRAFGQKRVERPACLSHKAQVKRAQDTAQYEQSGAPWVFLAPASVSQMITGVQ